MYAASRCTEFFQHVFLKSTASSEKEHERSEFRYANKSNALAAGFTNENPWV